MGKCGRNIQQQEIRANPDDPIMLFSALKQVSPQGRSERASETCRCPYVADCKRRENGAGNLFQGAGNKKSPRPGKDPEDCTRFFILACSPALEGTMVNSPSRSSGSWFTLLPVPSHPGSSQLSAISFRPDADGFPRQWYSRVSSPFTAAGPRGSCTLFPYPGVTMCRHNRRERQNLSSSIMSDADQPST